MSTEATTATTATTATKHSTPSAFSGSRAKTTTRHLTSEVIAADIAAFKRRGGSIEVLGNTSYLSALVATTFRSSETSKRDGTAAATTEGAARG